MRRSRVPAAFVVLIIASACHSYHPLIGETPSPGDDIRVRLANATALEISERVGQPIRMLDATVLDVAGDSLRLDVSWGAIYAGTRFEGRRDTLTFAQDQFVEMDRRDFSRGRTALLIAGVGGGIAMLVRTVQVSGGGRGGGGNGGGI